MYNGVGILTPRGTGTSGHVQTNKFNLRRAPVPKFGQGADGGAQQHGADRKPNKEILEHNRRRQIEIKLVELSDQLEEAG
jgi:serine/arginine repetitive matrix protein 2